MSRIYVHNYGNINQSITWDMAQENKGVVRRHLHVPNKDNLYNFHFEDFLYIKYKLNDHPKLLYNNKHL